MSIGIIENFLQEHSYLLQFATKFDSKSHCKSFQNSLLKLVVLPEVWLQGQKNPY